MSEMVRFVPFVKLVLNNLNRYAIYKLKQPLIWDHCYAALRYPKIESLIPQNNRIHEFIESELKKQNFDPVSLKIDVNDYKQWIQKAQYKKMWFYYFRNSLAKNIAEKSLEHYLAAKLLDLSKNDVYIDVASGGSPAAEIYRRIYGCKSYMQDMMFPRGIHQNVIGGNACNMPVEDNFASKMALHCSFEHFEGNSDIELIREANRVLKRGGRLCIIPLYLFPKYAIQTDPTVLPKGAFQLEKDPILFCSKKYWGKRHGRFYDVPHFISRIVNNQGRLKLMLYKVQNEKQIDPSCYVKFIALFEKG
jgi:SAM-dependent methyltransferase